MRRLAWTFKTLALMGWILAITAGVLRLHWHVRGDDFDQIWAAGRLMLRGLPCAPYMPGLLDIYIRGLTGIQGIVYLFVYPPPTLIFAIPFGVGGLAASEIAFVTFAICSLCVALRLTIRLNRAALTACVLSPAALVSFLSGQGGALEAALLVPCLAVGGSRPLLAGLLAGCLIWKPQAAILVPVCFLAGGRIRALLAAAAVTLVFVVGSTAWMGTLPWRLWWATLPHLTSDLMNRDLFVYYMASPLASMVVLHAPWAAAVAMQAAATIAAMAVAWVAWRRAPGNPVAVAAALALTPLAAPYSFTYDMVGATIAVAMILVCVPGKEFKRWEMAAMGTVWAAPAAVWLAFAYPFPVNFVLPISSALVAAVAFRRLPLPSAAMGLVGQPMRS